MPVSLRSRACLHVAALLTSLVAACPLQAAQAGNHFTLSPLSRTIAPATMESFDLVLTKSQGSQLYPATNMVVAGIGPGTRLKTIDPGIAGSITQMSYLETRRIPVWVTETFTGNYTQLIQISYRINGINYLQNMTFVLTVTGPPVPATINPGPWYATFPSRYNVALNATSKGYESMWRTWYHNPYDNPDNWDYPTAINYFSPTGVPSGFTLQFKTAWTMGELAGTFIANPAGQNYVTYDLWYKPTSYGQHSNTIRVNVTDPSGTYTLGIPFNGSCTTSG